MVVGVSINGPSARCKKNGRFRSKDAFELRQAIQRQLSRIEHAHRFTRAVSVGRPKEFIQAENQEQEIAERCKRPIKNRIVGWNDLYLSGMDKQGAADK